MIERSTTSLGGYMPKPTTPPAKRPSCSKLAAFGPDGEKELLAVHRGVDEGLATFRSVL